MENLKINRKETKKKEAQLSTELVASLLKTINTNDNKLNRLPLTNDQAASLLGLQPQTLHNWRHQRKGPRYHKIGRRVVYFLEDINKYSENCSVNLEG